MMKDNGYINITKLCKNGGKQFKHWKELKNSKEMMTFYEHKINQSSKADTLIPFDQSISSAVIPADQPTNQIIVIQSVTGGKGDDYDICRGTYLHPLFDTSCR